MTGTRRDALDPAERARQAGLPAAARANGWVGSPEPDGAERFWSKVEKTDDCWLWTGHAYHDGYGEFYIDRRQVRAHRWAYEIEVGPIPEGLVLDPLCRVRLCVRPSHLEPVTNRENLLRGIAARKGA